MRQAQRAQKVLVKFIYQLLSTYWVASMGPVWPQGSRQAGLGDKTPPSQDNLEL